MKISDQLREKIEERIATGELAPGSALDEASLVALHGVSVACGAPAFIKRLTPVESDHIGAG